MIDKKRNSSIELLRIIAMIMIIMSHYSVHGGFCHDSISFGFNKIFLHSILLGSLGVDIFFLISGYFLSKSEFKINKILKIIFQVISYTLIIYLLLSFINPEIFSKKELLRNLFPIIFEEYWFISTYIILYLMFPYLNILINNISHKEYKKLLITMIIIWSIIYTSLSFINVTFQPYSLFVDATINAILMYFIGAYIQLYGKSIIKKHKKLNTKIMIISILILFIITIICCKLNLGYIYILSFYHKNSFFIILISVTLFINMLNKNIDFKLINIISSCMFGVYLLHDNNYIRHILWHDILKSNTFQNSPYLIFHFFISILVVFSICTLIEFIRKNTIQKLADKYIDIVITKMNKLFNK